jgi:MFS family permease
VVGLRAHLRESRDAFRKALSNANIRRLELAATGSTIGSMMYTTAVAVFAFEADGAKGVALVWVIRTVPSGLAAPFLALLADRYSRKAVMIVADLGRAVLTVAAALMIWQDVKPIAVYLLVGVITLVGTMFAPAQAALMPSLARTPEELTAANVTWSTIDSLSVFAGPAIAGFLLAVTTPQTIVLISVVPILWSIFFVSRIEPTKEEAIEEAAARKEAEQPEAAERLLTSMLAGFKTVGTNQRVAIIVGLFGVISVALGIVEVLVVTLAIDLLDMGKAGVGYLTAAIGVGAVLGALIAAGFVGIRRLSVPFVGGAVFLSAPLAILGLAPSTVLAVVCLGAFGLGNAVLDVAGFTLLQRAVPENVLGRVWGVLQLTFLVTFGIGSAITPALLSAVSTETTLIITGVSIAVLTVLLGPRLISIDASATAPAADRLELLRRSPIFGPLSGPALERLAGQLIPLTVPAGHVLMREGEPGDRFYLLAKGRLDVAADGKPVATIHPGDYVGEIALLRDVPRTATVTASGESDLFALTRDDFLGAVTSHGRSREAAETTVSTRLAGLQGVTGRLPIPRV